MLDIVDDNKRCYKYLKGVFKTDTLCTMFYIKLCCFNLIYNSYYKIYNMIFYGYYF